MTDTLPPNVTFVSASDTMGGTITQSGGTVSDSLGTLAAGATDTITVVVTPTQAGTLTNTASVTTTSPNSSTNTTAAVTSTVNSGVTTPPSGQCYLPGKPGDGTDATFVSNLYFELLGRAPDQAGLNYWLSFLSGKGQANSFNNPREEELINVFLSTPEYRQHLITCMYEQFLHRAPDQAGLQYWVQLLNNGKDEGFVLSLFVGSQEFYNDAGATAQGFVTALYNDLLGRAPDAGGETYWVGVANNHANDRDSVVRSMLGTPEALHDLLNNPTSSALSNLTGGGWIQLYFQGNERSEQTAYNKLAGQTPWDDVIEDMLETPEYYDAGKPGL